MRSFVFTRPLILCVLLIGFFLAVFLLWKAYQPLSQEGYPYEAWDEIGASNDAVVLDAPESLRVYRYGSLDTFFHIVAHFVFSRFDPVGKTTIRHSFSNNQSPSISDPFFVFRGHSYDGLEYNYFRGVNFHEPIFIARQIYAGATVILMACLGLFAAFSFGLRSLAYLIAVLAIGTTPLFAFQATQALPNSINAALIAGIVLAVIVAFTRAVSWPFFAASVLYAFGLNMKIDILAFGAFVFSAFLAFLIAYRVRFWRACHLSFFLLLTFLMAFVATRPMVLVHPMAEWNMQFNTISGILVPSGTQLWGNWPKFVQFIAEDLLFIPGVATTNSWSFWLFNVLLVVVVVAPFALNALPRRLRAVLSVLVIIALLILWGIPMHKSVQLYNRYYLNGAAAFLVFLGFAIAVLLTAGNRLLRATGAAILLLLISLATMRIVELQHKALNLAAAYAPFDGLDPTHSRNRAILEIVKRVKAGEFPPRVFVDQHSYTDLYYLHKNGIRARYINMDNAAAILGKARRHLPVPILFVRGDGGWGPGSVEAERYRRFLEMLLALPKVFEVPGNVMTTLSPAPVSKVDGVVVVKSR